MVGYKIQQLDNQEEEKVKEYVEEEVKNPLEKAIDQIQENYMTDDQVDEMCNPKSGKNETRNSIFSKM